jgi:hypothetical protein
MDKPYAIVGSDNKAINFITWNGVNEFDYGQSNSNYLVPLENVERYGFGWLWNGNSFEIPSQPVANVPDSITRRQCALQLFAMGLITAEEAKQMTKDGTAPAAIQVVFETLNSEKKILAEIDFAAANYYHNNALIPSIMMAQNMTETDVDQFFITAAKL